MTDQHLPANVGHDIPKRETEHANEPEIEPEHEPEGEQGPKRRINGGLDAWLSVLAGFCVFVNSWLVR